MRRDLVERAMTGDHEAFSELARLTIARLHAVARLVVRDAALADDATQEALVAAWRQLPTLRDPDRFDPWLHRLLVRACYREASRHRRRRQVEAGALPVETLAADPSMLVADQDQLGRGFDRLTPEHTWASATGPQTGSSLERSNAVATASRTETVRSAPGASWSGHTKVSPLP